MPRKANGVLKIRQKYYIKEEPLKGHRDGKINDYITTWEDYKLYFSAF